MRHLREWFLAVVAGTALILVMFTGIAMIHDIMYPAEDSQVIWICQVDGDGRCGDSKWPSIQPSNLTRW